jgi:hypothetical protein
VLVVVVVVVVGDGWMDGWMDDGWMDGWMVIVVKLESKYVFYFYLFHFLLRL